MTVQGMFRTEIASKMRWLVSHGKRLPASILKMGTCSFFRKWRAEKDWFRPEPTEWWAWFGASITGLGSRPDLNFCWPCAGICLDRQTKVRPELLVQFPVITLLDMTNVAVKVFPAVVDGYGWLNNLPLSSHIAVKQRPTDQAWHFGR